MKAQSTIIQFIIFFLLGLGIFASIGSFFNYQSGLLKAQVTSSTLQLLKGYMSSIAVIEYDTCKRCNSINLTTKISNTTADYFVDISFAQNSLSILTHPFTQNITSSLSNLNYSTSLTPSSASSTQAITLTYDKNKNSIVVQ